MTAAFSWALDGPHASLAHEQHEGLIGLWARRVSGKERVAAGIAAPARRDDVPAYVPAAVHASHQVLGGHVIAHGQAAVDADAALHSASAFSKSLKM